VPVSAGTSGNPITRPVSLAVSELFFPPKNSSSTTYAVLDGRVFYLINRNFAGFFIIAVSILEGD
jgi:hypothetical protein